MLDSEISKETEISKIMIEITGKTEILRLC